MQPGADAQPASAGAIHPNGQQKDAPAEADMPDWLRIARQNNMPLYDERRSSAKVSATSAAPAEPPPVDMLGRPIARKVQQQPANLTPMTADEYAAAGYPPELIAQKMDEDVALRAAMGVGRKRHGAQLAAPPDRRQTKPQEQTYAPRGTADCVRQDRYGQTPQIGGYPSDSGRRPSHYLGGYTADATPDGDYANRAVGQDYAPRGGYTVYTEGGSAEPGEASHRRRNPYQAQQDEDGWQDDETDEQEKPRLRIPYLGIATFAAALALVLLWILRMTYTAQTASVLASREAAQARYQSSYPYAYRELIEREAAQNNLHPAFVAAIVLNESSFNPKAESDVGARGLMQMMPDTAERVHGKIGDTIDYSFDLMYDADTNVRYACWYLSYLSDIFRGDPVLVSAAFHAGQTTVQNWLNDSRYSANSTSIELSKMAEGPTKTYATRVLKAYAVYRRLYYEGGAEAAPSAADDSQTTPAA
jgi:soluble lytic murein transglycosylase